MKKKRNAAAQNETTRRRETKDTPSGTAPHRMSSRKRKNDNRELARLYRKSGAVASLIADISGTLEAADALFGDICDRLADAEKRLDYGMKETVRGTEGLASVFLGGERLTDSSSEASAAAGAVYRAFSRQVRALERRLAVTVELNSRFSEMKSGVDSLRSAADSGGDLAERIRRAADRADVAALNASLEASRTEGSVEMLSAVAGKAQKAAADFLRTVNDIADAVQAVRAGVAEYGERRAAAAERFRTVSAMSKSIGSAFGDTADSLDGLAEKIDDATLHAAEIPPVVEDLADAFETLSEASELCGDELGEVRALIERQRESFAAAADHADAMTDAARGLTDADTDAVDLICDAAGDIAESVAETLSLLEETRAAFDVAAGDAVDFDDLAGRIGDGIADLPSHVRALASVSGSVDSDMKTARKRLGDMVEVTGEFIRELEGLATERRAIEKALSAVRRSVRKLSRSLAACAYFPGSLDGIALSGRMAVDGTVGAGGNGFASYLREFEAVSVESMEAVRALTGFCDTLDDAIDALGDGASVRAIETLIESSGSLSDDIVTLLSDEMASAEDDVSLIADIAGELADTVETVAESGDGIISSYRASSEAIEASAQGMEALRARLEELSALSARISSAAAELFTTGE